MGERLDNLRWLKDSWVLERHKRAYGTWREPIWEFIIGNNRQRGIYKGKKK